MVLHSRAITQTLHLRFPQSKRIRVLVVKYRLNVLKGEVVLSPVHCSVLCDTILSFYLETYCLTQADREGDLRL